MSEPKFTPGPWRFEWDNFGDGEGTQPVIIEDKRPGNLIAAVYDAAGDGLAGKNDTENAAGSAFLIAAAPELYEALEVLDGYLDFACPDGSAAEEDKTRARAALAKARGES